MSNNATNANPISFPYNFSRPPVQIEFLNGIRDMTLSGMGPYVAETTQRFAYGTRGLTWDGRVFRYGKAFTYGVCSSIGAANVHGGGAGSNTTGPTTNTISSHAAPTQVGDASGLAGCSVVTVAIHTGDYHGEIGDGIVAKDELVGGYVVIGNGTAQSPDFRGIVGNSACTASTTSTIQLYLDGPIFTAITAATTNIEVLANPYTKLVCGANYAGTYGAGNGYVSFLGIPAVDAATLYSFWLQTWGPCWGTSAGATNNGANDRELYFATNGSLISGADLTYAGASYQRAGFAMEKTSSGYSGPPLVMLQISV